VAELPDLITRLLRLGPELLAETEPRRFADDLRRHGFTDAEIHRVMNENGFPLTVRAP